MVSIGGRMRRAMRNRPGQSLVEFVLLAPVLLLLIFGLVEFARGWNIRHVVTDAAREGARYLAVDNGMTQAEVLTAVEAALGAAGLNPDDATITIVQCDGAGCASSSSPTPGEPARVTINYPYTLGITGALLSWALEDRQINIGTTFVMRNE